MPAVAPVSSRLRIRYGRIREGQLVWGYELTDSEHSGSRTLGRVRDYGGFGVGYRVDWLHSDVDVVDWFPRRGLEPLSRPRVGDIVWVYAVDDFHHRGSPAVGRVFARRVDGSEFGSLIAFRTYYDGINWIPSRQLEIANVPSRNRGLNSSRSFVALMDSQ